MRSRHVCLGAFIGVLSGCAVESQIAVDDGPQGKGDGIEGKALTYGFIVRAWESFGALGTTKVRRECAMHIAEEDETTAKIVVSVPALTVRPGPGGSLSAKVKGDFRFVVFAKDENWTEEHGLPLIRVTKVAKDVGFDLPPTINVELWDSSPGVASVVDHFSSITIDLTAKTLQFDEKWWNTPRIPIQANVPDDPEFVLLVFPTTEGPYVFTLEATCNGGMVCLPSGPKDTL